MIYRGLIFWNPLVFISVVVFGCLEFGFLFWNVSKKLFLNVNHHELRL